MSESWQLLFDEYWKNRAGAPYGHNPQKVFEAGFLAGVKQAPDLSAGAVTLQTEYGVQYPPEPDDPIPVWVAKDIYEALGDALVYHGKLIRRTVGPWEVME